MAKRVAVVTGSNKGIGLATVRGLCKQFQGDVILTSRTESLGREAVQTLEKEGLSPKYHQLDVTNRESIERLRDFLKENYGGLDVLVNNAGRAFKASATEPFSEQAKLLTETNFFGVLNVTEILAPIIRPHARICNVSSVATNWAMPNCSKEIQEKFTSKDLTKDELVKLISLFVESAQTGDHVKQGFADFAYGMSKIGLTALTGIQQRDFDKNGADDIVVNCCCPGHVMTDMNQVSGKLTTDEGAVTPIYLSLLPPNVGSPRGEFLIEGKVTEFKPMS